MEIGRMAVERVLAFERIQGRDPQAMPHSNPGYDVISTELGGATALAQLREWLKEMVAHVASTDERGCPLANAAVELPEKGHPARRVIEEAKAAHRLRLVHLCSAAGLSEADMLADELDLLLEGARVSAQSVGSNGLGARLIRMGEAMIASHSSR
jgi:hypothetical protein